MLRLLVLPCLIIASAACATEAEQRVDVTAVRDAATVLQEHGTARIIMRGLVEGGGASETIEMRADVDFATGDAVLVADGLFEGRTIGTTAYYRAEGRPGWLKVEMSDELVDQFAELAGTDPLAGLELITTAGSIEEVGRERLGDVETTVFSATFDFEKVADLFGLPPEALAELESMDVESELLAYLDDQGVLRRMEVDMSFGDEFSMRMVQDIKDLGEPVEVEPPPAEDIVRTETVDDFMEMQTIMGEFLGG